MTKSKQLGDWAEAKAAEMIQNAGFELIQQNYHSRFGEVDIIAQKDDELIFVEVKARTNSSMGASCEVITSSKQLKIVKTALIFIDKNPQYLHFYYRFDVICFDLSKEFAKNLQQDFSQMAYDQQWIENAFTINADLINL